MPALPIPAFARDLCLHYANTRYWRGSEEPTESLAGPGDLLAWLAEHGGHDRAVVAAAEAWAGAQPEAAARLFAEAIALRETVYRAFAAIAAQRAIDPGDLGALNRALSAAPARRRMVPAAAGCAWEIDYPGPSAPALLAAVLWSAGDLIVDGGHGRLRQCANDKCLWLFLDDSKGATRRWCDMKSCGNRLKARRHYLKRKAAARPG
jgi:predicted RNA-binding Zn ribbon-like protein